MIIYHAQPLRTFPYLTEILCQHFNVPYQLHEPYEVVNWKDEQKALDDGLIIHRIDDDLPRRIKFNPDYLNCTHETNGRDGNKVVDFCYGVFSKSKLSLAEGDFVFNIIKHPVARIYDLYQYMQFEMGKLGDGKRYDKMRLGAKDYKDMSLEQFIDHFIENDGDISFPILGIQYKLIQECVRLAELPDYEFIGIDEYLPISLHILGDYLGFQIPYTGRLTETSSIEYKSQHYRQKDLAVMLEEDIRAYEEALLSLRDIAVNLS